MDGWMYGKVVLLIAPALNKNGYKLKIEFKASSILVYHFCKHALHFCSTWMTSRMHIEKRGG